MVGKAQKAAQQSSATLRTPATSQATASSSDTSGEEKVEAGTADGLGTEVLSTLHSMKMDFPDKFENVLAGISGLKSELQSQANRITETDDRIGRAEDNLHALHSTIKKLKEKCATLETRVEEQENRGRRNNLRVIGLAEKAEGQDVLFWKDGYQKLLAQTSFPPLPSSRERTGWDDLTLARIQNQEW